MNNTSEAIHSKSLSRVVENHRPTRRLGSFAFGAALLLSQCEEANPGCTPFDPYAVSTPADAPGYYTHGGFRQAQNRQPIRVARMPLLSVEQQQQTIADWNKSARRELFQINNNNPNVIFIEQDWLVDGANKFRPYSGIAINESDGSFTIGAIYYDKDHLADVRTFIESIEHEMGHMAGAVDSWDGVTQVADMNAIKEQCYDPMAHGGLPYMGAISIMSYCASTRSNSPTEADRRMLIAMGEAD